MISLSWRIIKQKRAFINGCFNFVHVQQKHTFTSTRKKPNKTTTKTTRIATNRRRNHHRSPPKPRRESIPFLTDLKEIRDPDEALSLFHEYLEMGSKHDYPSYASLLYKLARGRHFYAVETVLGYIQDYNIRCKEIVFMALMEHYGKAGLVDEAIGIFHRMKTSFECVRTLQSLNTILNVLVENDRLFDAKRLFDNAGKMGFRLNSIPFNILIKGWLKKGEWEEACKVFDEMLERRVSAGVSSYNSLIGFLCRKGDVERAKELVEEMIRKGKYPNAVTYALLMEGLCLQGEYNEAKKVMFDMAYKGCKPEVVNFGVLMSDLGKRGKIDEAKGLVSEMKKRRYKLDVVTYNILINYLCKEGRVGEAYKVFIEMQVEGCEANAATFRMMLDGFCRVKDYEGGLKVLNVMLSEQHCPRLESFCCLVVGLLKGGKIDYGCFVLEEMEKRKLRLDLTAWEDLVRDASVGVGVDEGDCMFGLMDELISMCKVKKEIVQH